MQLGRRLASRLSAQALLPLLPLALVACTSPGNSGETVAPRAEPAAHTTAFVQRRGPATMGDALADEAPAHLSISLRLEDDDGLAALLRDQQDPRSPRFHAWLTPAEFGQRFGLSEAKYARVLDWLRGEGFRVTPYPNRLFAEAFGTVGAVRRLVGVQLRMATDGKRSFRSYEEDLALPEDIAPLVLKVGGLDTRIKVRHHMNVNWYGSPTQALDADDLRTQYDIPLTGAGAAGLTLVVLGTEEGTQPNQNANPTGPWVPPDKTAIDDYLTTLAHATVTYNPINLPNTDDDYDTVGSNSEYQLDVEMQSVGAPNAKEIDLVLSPASVVFQTGAMYIANMLSNAVVVSTSDGLCESEEVGYDGGAVTDTTSDAYIMRMAIQQGVSEGQTWFAAAGDMGADDCNDNTSGTGNGFGGGNATVDFPCSAPETLCVGGTMFKGAGSWSSSGALQGYNAEVTCNEGAQGVATGGGQSMLFKKPAYQQGVGPEQNDGQRDLPDLALMAASNTPGVVDYDCGEGQDTCGDAGTGIPLLDITGGTSVASPLTAGIFANLAGTVGCRQGDIHTTIYALGAAEQASPGPNQPFHDITTGNNDWVDPAKKKITGFTAGPGYDLVTGWGSFDVGKLIAAWPPCPTHGGGADGGMTAGQDSGSAPADAGHLPGQDGGGRKQSVDAGSSGGSVGSESRSSGGAASSAQAHGSSNGGGRVDAAARAAPTADGGNDGGCAASGGRASCGAVWLVGLALARLGSVRLARRRRRRDAR
jgi:subtilase family serine protease